MFDLPLRPRRIDAAQPPAPLANPLRRMAPVVSPAARVLPTVAEARTALRSGVDALREALAALNRRLQPVTTLSQFGAAGAAANVEGLVNSLGTYSTLSTTREVNEQTSTVRSSSAALGLDITSPERTSQLSATGTLGLDVTSPESGSSLTSSAEANTAATSYGVVQAAFTRGSSTQTSLGDISGVYAGTGLAALATSLKLTITSDNATMGATPVEMTIRVQDQNGVLIGSFSGTVAADEAISLGADTGLSIAFTAGSIIKNANTTFSVDKNTPTDADPNAVFNDADVNLRPRFDNNAQITAGSFTINGATINALAGDTINTVLARINSSGAGVSASFSGDKLTLQTTANSEDDIEVANDTSGFLAALKLSTGNTVRGNIHDDAQVLAKTTQFAAVASGSFTVNGVAVTINSATDSLQSVITKINSAGAGVTAAYDAATDKITLTTTANSEDDIVLANDTTGFLAAAKLSGATTVKGNIRDDQQMLAKTSQFDSVVSGSFSINGTSISVDAATDSLQSVIARINSAGAGVTAAYDAATDKFVITPDTPGATLILSNDTSGFLTAAKVPLGASGTTVNPAAPFNGTGSNAPLFEDGKAVTAGAFQINGVSIAVAADDSLTGVLAKITGSAAGVTATFDVATEKITLTAKIAGPNPITLGNDSTGFFAAVKLDTAVAGSTGVSTLTSALANHAIFSGVTSGTITINGQPVAVNPASDTLTGLVAAINDLSGVTATLDSATGKVTLAAEQAGTDLDIADTSGLLGALGIASGKIVAGPATLQLVETDTGKSAMNDPQAVADTVADAVGRVNEALDLLRRARYASPVFRDQALKAVRDAVAALPDAAAKGLSFVESGGALRLNVNSSQLAVSLADDPQSLGSFLSGTGNLPDTLDGLLTTYSDSTGAVAAYPASVVSTEEAARPQLGDKTKAALMNLERERSLSLLSSPPPTLKQADAGRTGGKADAPGFTNKAKAAYGVTDSEGFGSAGAEKKSALTLKAEPPSPFLAAQARQAYGLTLEPLVAPDAADARRFDLPPAADPRLRNPFVTVADLLG
jgi:hypothetical protein